MAAESRGVVRAKEGVIPKAERGRYPLVGAVRGYIQYLQDQAAQARADISEIEIARLRSQLLALPDRLAPTVHKQKTVEEVKDVIQAAIRMTTQSRQAGWPCV